MSKTSILRKLSFQRKTHSENQFSQERDDQKLRELATTTWSTIAGTPVLSSGVGYQARKISSDGREALQRKSSKLEAQLQKNSLVKTSKVIESKQQANLRCPVCLKEYNNPKRLPCDHVTCASCLQDYMNPKSLVCCPICHNESFVIKGDTSHLPDDKETNQLLEVRHKAASRQALRAIPLTKEEVSKRMNEVRVIEGSLEAIETNYRGGLKELEALSVAMVEKQTRLIQRKGEQFRKELEQRLKQEEIEGNNLKEKIRQLHILEKEAGTGKDEKSLTSDYKALIYGQDELKKKVMKRNNTIFTLNDDFTINETVKKGDISLDTWNTPKRPTPPKLNTKEFLNVKRPFGVGICPWNQNIYICLPEKQVVEVYHEKGPALPTIESAPDLNFMYPIKVAFYAKTQLIYILDKWERNLKIMKSIDEGEHSLVRTLFTKGNHARVLKEPCGLALDKEGNIYIADRGSSRVQKFNAEGEPLITIGGTMERGQGDKEQWVSHLDHPEDININAAGTILVVADTGNHRVKLFDLDGKMLHEIGMKGSGQGMFEFPSCAVFHPLSNTILVGDSENNRIQAFSDNGNHLKSYNGHNKVSNIATSAASHNLTLISYSFKNSVIIAK